MLDAVNRSSLMYRVQVCVFIIYYACIPACIESSVDSITKLLAL